MLEPLTDIGDGGHTLSPLCVDVPGPTVDRLHSEWACEGHLLLERLLMNGPFVEDVRQRSILLLMT